MQSIRFSIAFEADNVRASWQFLHGCSPSTWVVVICPRDTCDEVLCLVEESETVVDQALPHPHADVSDLPFGIDIYWLDRGEALVRHESWWLFTVVKHHLHAGQLGVTTLLVVVYLC